MVVCHCHALTDRDIRKVAAQGARCSKDVEQSCRAGGDCGGCRPVVERILRQAHLSRAGNCAAHSAPRALAR